MQKVRPGFPIFSLPSLPSPPLLTLPGPQKEKIVLRVSLPTGIYRTMAFQPNQKMHAVLTGVCAKSKLDPTEHLLYYEGAMVSRDLTVSGIASGELKLVERSSTVFRIWESERENLNFSWNSVTYFF
jgi:hypothetical protein